MTIVHDDHPTPDGPTPASTRHVTRVAAPTERVFWAFVNLDLVKPKDHNLLEVPIEETVVEPRPGGAILDRGTDGSTCHWGTVETFEPPHRFAFRWHIGPDWQVSADPGRSSLVDVRFEPEGDGTLVTLTHLELDRHGEDWEDLRRSVDTDNGWPLYLARLEAAATADGDA
ncbi:SRPBCC domain-containing protein [Phycicoccus flavus]|uniref:SRPBCC domain-containing protein n=1 Tax=Phycicoccus flavus TaxID=2502783 RepID=UPI000FEC0FC4|nr:SRPBCC domain-containing protein [Phycicoccus flavus]NHA70150.1 ATPase [Phycicoccus flavus]